MQHLCVESAIQMFPAYLVMTNASGCTSHVVFLVDAFDVQGGYMHRQFGGVPELGSRFPRGKRLAAAVVDITLRSIGRTAARQIVGPAFPGESGLFSP